MVKHRSGAKRASHANFDLLLVISILISNNEFFLHRMYARKKMKIIKKKNATLSF